MKKFNILYILPSRKWGQKERQVFKDIELAKLDGHQTILLSHPDTFVSKRALELGIETIILGKHFFNRFFTFHSYAPCIALAEKRQVDLIHIYDFEILFSISYQLNRHPLISLVVTVDHILQEQLKRLWFRPLIYRIDALLMLNPHLRNNLIGNLGLPTKKMAYFGTGVVDIDREVQDQIQQKFEIYKDYFLAGAFLPPAWKDVDHIVPALLALKIINQEMPGGKRSKLVLFSDHEFAGRDYFFNLKKVIEDHELQDDVLFIETQKMNEGPGELSLWICLNPDELIEDHALMALFNEVPVLFARNFTSKSFIYEHEGIGETYKLHDARELRENWTRILMGHSVFRDKVRLYKYFITREHHYPKYQADLLSLYTKLVQRRKRVFRKKN